MSLFRVQGSIQRAPGASWWESADFAVCPSLAALDAYLAPVFDSGEPYGSDFEANTLNPWPGVRTGAPPQIVSWIVSRGPHSARYVPLNHLEGYEYNLPQAAVLERMQRLDAAKIPAILFNGLYELELWRVCLGWEPTWFEDVLFSIHLVNPNERTFGLKDASLRILGLVMLELSSLLTKADFAAGKTFAHLSPMDPAVVAYACPDGSNTRLLHFHPSVVAARERQRAIYQLEMQFLPVLREAMRTGCYLDRAALDRIAEQLGGAVKVKNTIVTPYRGLMGAMRAQLLAAIGKDDTFNLNAKAQLGQALIESGVPIVERTAKGQVSTDKKVIGHYGQLIDEATGEPRYPVIQQVIRWGELATLEQSYIRKLIQAHEIFGSWIRFPFTQWGAPTGRMSGGGATEGDGTADLNAQGLPKSDDDDGLDVRSCIVAADPLAPEAAEWAVVSIDFNGFQLRIAANYSREPVWMQAFLRGLSLHLETAKAVFKKPDAVKDSKEYDRGKTGNFTVLFGGQAQTIARAFKIPLKEAEQFFEDYWRALPYLRNWILQTHGHARREHRVRTIFGRERPLAEYYDSPERWLQLKGDREAVSHIIQGSEADLFKASAIRARRLIHARGWTAAVHIMLFVHDALVLRCRRDQLDTIVPEIVRVMEGTEVPGWPVPLRVDVKVGANWGQSMGPYPIVRAATPVEAAPPEARRPPAPAETVVLPPRPPFRAG